jgi:hypothetical protein
MESPEKVIALVYSLGKNSADCAIAWPDVLWGLQRLKQKMFMLVPCPKLKHGVTT